MNKHKLYWVLQIGGWIFYAVVQIFGFILFEGKNVHTSQVVFWIIEALIFFIFSHIFRNIIVGQGWLIMRMPSLIPRIIFSVFFLGFLVYGARLLVSSIFNMYNPSMLFDIYKVVSLSCTFALIFFVWAVLYFIYHYFEKYNISLQHEAALHEIELNNLKSQLNPHFIFNALNSIRALVDENPLKSKNAITQLSNILRNSLISDKKRLTKFEDEFNTVRDYLSLESIRFEERLCVKFDIHPESYEFLVPPLMLQTLVENGIKHGISKLKEGGIIHLKTFISDSQLKVQIRNSGQLQLEEEVSMPENENKPGLGLKNTRKRLNLLYGDEAYLKVSNESENIVITELVIPK
ncbi:sensor histidine kinase [Fulvivirga sediminis]|nr:histidine kinase [Fulvivirga sediminis]